MIKLLTSIYTLVIAVFVCIATIGLIFYLNGYYYTAIFQWLLDMIFAIRIIQLIIDYHHK